MILVSKIVAVITAFSICITAPTMAGGYEGVLETYKLERPDGSAITMYENPDRASAVLGSIPSGTTVRIIKGNPVGWILIEYENTQGCVMGSGEILCTGVRVPTE